MGKPRLMHIKVNSITVELLLKRPDGRCLWALLGDRVSDVAVEYHRCVFPEHVGVDDLVGGPKHEFEKGATGRVRMPRP